jgi:hypothetical protein
VALVLGVAALVATRRAPRQIPPSTNASSTAPRPSAPAPTPPAAPEPLGLIEVATTPPGATLYVDGKSYAKPTPTVIDRMPVGHEHVLLVQLAGYKEELRRVTVPASGFLKLDIPLTAIAAPAPPPPTPTPKRTVRPVEREAHPAPPPRPVAAPAPAHAPTQPAVPSNTPGRLLFAAEPWAEVIIDGKPHGATPLSIEVPPGTYSVVLVCSQLHQSKTFTIVVNPGETVRKKVLFTVP